jgi:hypothetical protein
VLLVFDPLQLSLQRGVFGVAAAAPVEMGLHHGIYAHGDTAHRVRAYLHKPSKEELERWNAIQDDGLVQIDTGLIWLDAQAAWKFAALTQAQSVASICRLATEVGPEGALNLYGDLILPLAESTTLESYLADTSDGPATPDVVAARRVIWPRLHGTAFTSERLQPAMFIHFGTLREYWETVAADPALQNICGWTPHAAAWAVRPAADMLTLINSAVEKTFEVSESPEVCQPALIVDSRLNGTLEWQGAAMLANVDTVLPIALTQDVVLHQLPVEDGFVTRVLGLHDDPKRLAAEATFYESPVGRLAGRCRPRRRGDLARCAA